MVAALTKIESRPGLGREGGHGDGGRNDIHLDPFLPLPTFLRDQHTQYHSIPHPMGSLLLGWEDRVGAAPPAHADSS